MSSGSSLDLTLLGAVSVMAGALAALFTAVWLRAREPGMAWLVFGFLMASIWYGVAGHLVSTGPIIDTWSQRLGSLLIGTAVILVSVGVSRHLGLTSGPLRWFALASLVPGIAQLLWLAMGGSLEHRYFHYGVLMAYAGAAVLAFRQAALAPGDGHLVLGLALSVLAFLPSTLAWAGVAPDQFKYFAGVSLIVFGIVFLAVSLLRRHRLLRQEVDRRSAAEERLHESNLRLEATVAERTADLRALVSGLEFFNRGLSHDLRGPLGGMSQLAKLAVQGLNSGDAAFAQRALNVIADQCETSMQLVATMLELARIGEITAKPEPLDLQRLVQAAFDECMLGRTAGPPPQLRFSGPSRIRGDARLLRPVLVNLLANAVKFTGATTAPVIEVSVRQEEGKVSICVMDNGTGFDPQVAKRLFEPFYRSHGDKYAGYGLGLSIALRAIEGMGGRIWSENRAQGGAAFCFELPHADLGGATAGKAAEQPAPMATA